MNQSELLIRTLRFQVFAASLLSLRLFPVVCLHLLMGWVKHQNQEPKKARGFGKATNWGKFGALPTPNFPRLVAFPNPRAFFGSWFWGFTHPIKRCRHTTGNSLRDKREAAKTCTVVSDLIILIDSSEQSNCSLEHSRLQIEVKKCIDNFKKYVKGKSQIKTGENFSLSVGATKRPNCPPDSSNFQFSNPVQPCLDISNQEQYAVSSSAPAVIINVSFSAPSSLLFHSNAAQLSLHNTNWPTPHSIFPETNRNASNNDFDHRGILNAENSNQCSISSMSLCFQNSVPKLHPETFNGAPVRWIKRYSIFKAIIDQSSMSSAEK